MAGGGGGASVIQTCSATSGSCLSRYFTGSEPRLAVAGGGGGGGGEGPPGEGGGSGSGFGVGARPAGAFIVENGSVRWQPAIDPNRVIGLAVVALLVLRSIVKTRARTKRARAKAS